MEGESIDFVIKPNQFTTVTVVFVSWGKVVRLLVWPPGIPGEVSKDSVSAAASTAARPSADEIVFSVDIALIDRPSFSQGTRNS